MNIRFSRALNGMKQKVKKINKEYEADIKRFQEVSMNFVYKFHIEMDLLSRIQKVSSVNMPLLLRSPQWFQNRRKWRKLMGKMREMKMVTSPVSGKAARLWVSPLTASSKTFKLYKKVVERRLCSFPDFVMADFSSLDLRTQTEQFRSISWKSCLKLPIPRINGSVFYLHSFHLDSIITPPCPPTCLSTCGSLHSMRSTS